MLEEEEYFARIIFPFFNKNQDEQINATHALIVQNILLRTRYNNVQKSLPQCQRVRAVGENNLSLLDLDLNALKS